MPDLFKEIEIETVSACSRSCWHCKYGIEKEFPKGRRLPTALIDHIINQLSEIDYSGQINWYSTNEPLLEKRLFQILERSSNRIPRAKQFLVSNGDLLDQKTLDGLFTSGLKLLYISCYDDLTFNKVNSLAPPSGSSVKIMDFRSNTVIPGYFNRGGSIEALSEEKNLFLDQYCHSPSFQMAIASDGALKLCCADMYGEGFKNTPNIAQMSLIDLWHYHELVFARKELEEQGRSNMNICKSCNFNSSLRWPQETAEAMRNRSI